MAIIKVRGVGSGGISEDIPSSELPLNTFSYGENVTFIDGKIENTPNIEPLLKGVHGEVQWFSTRYNQVSKEPELVYVSRDVNGDDHLYIIKDVNLENSDGSEKGIEASRVIPVGDSVPYTQIESARFSRWQGFSSNGVVVLTNGIDTPQVLMPTSDQFEDLPNWPVTKTCKTLVPFKGVWVAMNINDSAAPAGTNNKTNMVMWSSALTDVGTYPTSWEPTDLTGAGFNYLSETAGAIQTGAPLQDFFLIYKTDSIVRMDYTGDVLNPFIFRTINYENGIWSSTSLALLQNKHFVVSANGVYITNGGEVLPVSNQKIQNELTALIYENSTTEDVIVATDYSNTLINVLIKHTVDGQRVTSWFSYNYTADEWSRHTPVETYIDYIAFMPILEANASQVTTWSSNAVTWDSIGNSFAETWDATSVRGMVSKIAVIFDSKVYVHGSYRNRDDGTEFLLKKHDIDFDDAQGVDSSFIKTLTNLYPICSGSSGYLVLKIWGHDKAGEEIDESNKKHYVINLATDYKFDIRVAGRYLSFELFMDKDIVANWESYAFQNYIPKPTSQPKMYLNLTGLDYDLSLTQRR